ncbi:MAG TPA: hypothetical protein GX525_05315 [Bacilli bacterium]|nr:hypothetical protein [Bacilli bacterium]
MVDKMVNDVGILFILVIAVIVPILFFVFRKKGSTNASKPNCDDDTCWWRR